MSATEKVDNGIITSSPALSTISLETNAQKYLLTHVRRVICLSFFCQRILGTRHHKIEFMQDSNPKHAVCFRSMLGTPVKLNSCMHVAHNDGRVGATTSLIGEGGSEFKKVMQSKLGELPGLFLSHCFAPLCGFDKATPLHFSSISHI